MGSDPDPRFLVVVDLLTSYSNRHDLCYDLQELAEQLRVEVARETRGAPGRVSVRPTRPTRTTWRVTDRLGEEEVRAIIVRFEQGIPKHILADEYGISLSSMKNLLRKHKAHQPWQVSDRLSSQAVEDLMRAFDEGAPQWKLAKQYGVSQATVSRLVRSHPRVSLEATRQTDDGDIERKAGPQPTE